MQKFAQNIIMIYQNKITKPPDKKPGIVIISQMMAIPGFLSGGFSNLFSKLSPKLQKSDDHNDIS